MRREGLIIARRLLQSMPIIFGIISISFVLLNAIPGDVVDIIAASADTKPEQIEALRRHYGLDQPLLTQYVIYVLNVVRFDLGYSVREGRPVAQIIVEHLWPTILLMISSMSLSFTLGLVSGIAGARRANTLVDNAITTVTTLLFSIPNFWLALILVIIFSLKLGWLPVSGYITAGMGPDRWERVLDVAHHLVLPVLSLSAIFIAIYARLMRSSLLEVLDLDFMRTARTKGLSEKSAIYRHGLRNALLPMVTFVGLQSASLLGGAVVVETVFAWPGIGSLALSAVLNRDHNLVLGILLMSALLVVTINLIMDFIYAWLDPRIEIASRGMAK